MSKPKSHTADIDVTCSAPWRRLNASAAILRLMRSPVLRITAEASGNRSSTFGSRHDRGWSGLSFDHRSIVTPNVFSSVSIGSIVFRERCGRLTNDSLPQTVNTRDPLIVNLIQ